MKTPLRVMLMVRELGPGGTERQLTELAKALDRDLVAPHVGYFREGPRAQELRDRGIPLLRLPVTSFMSGSAWSGALELRRYLHAHQIEIVHTFDYPLNCFGVPVARFSRTPVVLSSQRASRRLNPQMYQRLLRATDRMVDAVVVNCESVRQHLIEDEGVPAAHIRMCPNGIDTSRFHLAPRNRPAELDGSSLVIGTVCVLRPEKDLATLQEAFARVARRHAGLRLAIVGSGPEKESLEQRARTLGIDAQSLFVPATTEVTRWLHAIDIFVLPSLSEAFSNSLMEAMACGCAVVASNVGGNPELVKHRQTGLLFRPGDVADLAEQIDALVTQPELRRQIADVAAARIANEFSAASSARRMEGIYEEFARKTLR
jgi:glycosyltransferase involved in cell wall biosynthesis